MTEIHRPTQGSHTGQAQKAERQAKTAFLGRIGHEFRTPLNSILGFTQLLQEEQPSSLSAGQQKKIDNIEKAGWHLLQLVNDLLDLTNVENESIEIHLAALRVVDSVNANVELVSPLAGKRDISIEVTTTTDCNELLVWADPTRLKQVILNLLTNAIKYNKHGGKVEILIEPSKADRIKITVIDTGSGIPEHEQSSIFEPFTRRSTSMHSTGSGIGLTLVLELVTLMGGKVGLTSQPGKGSSFWIELRRAEEIDRAPCRQVQEIPGVEIFPADNAEEYQLLYIEDSPSHTELVSQIIAEMEGVTVVSASTPQHGLELARALNPILILLDLCLPEMDGYTVLNCLRQHEQTRTTPVIALSANAMPEDIDEALRRGFRRFITKPINVKEFRQTVLELLADEIAAK